ncbi:hypothetical protein LP316_12835 [Thalassotalea sp. LPB0316]|uniref:hypothetical protein n=1 Tax=Thalassotalea sp. LPB0316 TaxID=2769490 RepID=UPI0018678699|nr:hypothetical protein [Thalassotalea sp. LPB0316]QOL25176.1 hypothetical protein LP316_12835 [Thalassotalea sp. LPB0316]
MKQYTQLKTINWLTLILLSFSFTASAQKLIWLKPIESDLTMEGSRITSGAALDLMQFVASQIDNVEHEFHAYPVKRSWYLIQRELSVDKVYCFWGADYHKERESWGIFTQPAAITLPYMVAVRKNELTDYTSNGAIEVTKLLNDDYTTVIYDKVINAWTKIIDRVENKDIVKVSGINQDLSDHTVLMLERKRIDFGYVSYRAIANLDLFNNPKIDLYEIHEMSLLNEKSSRMLCSKTPLGKQYSELIDSALTSIQQNRELNHKLRDLTFKSEGYPENLKARFNERWHKAFPTSTVSLEIKGE